MTTEIVLAEVHSVGCGKHQYMCTCEAPANHEHNHRCRCGGEWTGEDATLVWHKRPGWAAPSPLDPHPQLMPGYADFRAVVDEFYEEMMRNLFADPEPLFKVMPAVKTIINPVQYYGKAFINLDEYMQLTKPKGIKPISLVAEISEPDYERLIKQCEPPKALQSGEVRSDRRD